MTLDQNSGPSIPTSNEATFQTLTFTENIPHRVTWQRADGDKTHSPPVPVQLLPHQQLQRKGAVTPSSEPQPNQCTPTTLPPTPDQEEQLSLTAFSFFLSYLGKQETAIQTAG